MKCPNCGNEIAEGSVFCEFCGKPVKLQRNGFVTFWLYLIMVESIMPALKVISKLSEIPDTEYKVLLVIGACLLLVCAEGADMLLKWKKWGFWLILIISIIELIAGLYATIAYALPAGEMSAVMLFVGLKPTLLYSVLQITKNGISCWSQLK